MSKVKTIRVVAAVLCDGNRVFATQRGYGEWKDYWEFPGGKIEPGETPEEALKREILEELDTEIAVGKKITTIEYDYPAFHLSMDCFFAAVTKGGLVLKEHEAARWLGKEEWNSVNWLPADQTIIDLLLLPDAEAFSVDTEKVIVGCFQDNPASAAVIRKNGGVLTAENDNYKNGRLCQYYRSSQRKTKETMISGSEPLEIERKFLIRYPDLDLLERICTEKKEIVQTYLISAKGISRRIRETKCGENTEYWYNEKEKISERTRIEREREISAEEYTSLRREALPDARTIYKTRYCIPSKDRCFEVDVFPEWDDRAYAEVELEDENQEFEIPQCLSVIKEVTEDRRYSNLSLAKNGFVFE